jgi:hypothetical protein
MNWRVMDLKGMGFGWNMHEGQERTAHQALGGVRHLLSNEAGLCKFMG